MASADLDASETNLQVRWRDGHESTYPLPHLRKNCPCAACRADRQQREENPLHILSAPLANSSAVMAGVEPVGRYGMKILWQDGHETGIYTFEFLRELCPCAECTAKRKTT